MRCDQSCCIFMALRSFAVVYPATKGNTDQKKDRNSLARASPSAKERSFLRIGGAGGREYVRATMAVQRRSELVPIVEYAAGSLGYHDLREQQRDAIITFLEGNDVSVSLPTGYGKSLCYGCLPVAFGSLRSDSKSIVIVISPLVALVKDQVKNFESKGLAAGYVPEGSSHEMKLGVLSGAFQLVFFSPDAILNQNKCRHLHVL